MIKHPIVKYDNKFWTLEKIENNLVVLWRNGERKEVNSSEFDLSKIQ